MSNQPFLTGLDDLFTPPPGPPEVGLWNFPDVSGQILTEHAKSLGLAGELLAASVLLRYGLQSTALPEAMPADRIIYHPGALLRLQIKTCSRAGKYGYTFNIRKGYNGSPGGVRRYAPGDFDMLALVALSDMVVRFTADHRPSQSIHLDEVDSLRAHPRCSLEIALDALGLATPGSTPTATAQPNPSN